MPNTRLLWYLCNFLFMHTCTMYDIQCGCTNMPCKRKNYTVFELFSSIVRHSFNKHKIKTNAQIIDRIKCIRYEWIQNTSFSLKCAALGTSSFPGYFDWFECALLALFPLPFHLIYFDHIYWISFNKSASNSIVLQLRRCLLYLQALTFQLHFGYIFFLNLISFYVIVCLCMCVSL